jgi:hypothetical protein
MNLNISAADHFPLEDWADFARHVARPENCTAMQRHLDDRCGACTALHNTLVAVDALARADAQYEPPASTMRLAQALYSQPKPAGCLERALESVRLLFDSQLAPATAGVRGGPARPRQLLFASSDRVIDLQVMPSHERARTVLIGQIAAAPPLERRFNGLAVLLRQGTTQVAATSTTEFGEFQMDFSGPVDDLSLTIGADHDVMFISLRTLTKVQS